MARKPTEPEPTEQEKERVRALLLDTLLATKPLLAANVRAELQLLLVLLGRPRLAKYAESV